MDTIRTSWQHDWEALAEARRLIRLQIIDFGFSFSLFFSVQKGLGLHSSEIKPEDELAFNKANYAFTVLYVSLKLPLVTSELVH
jgi:hypothetical protein